MNKNFSFAEFNKTFLCSYRAEQLNIIEEMRRRSEMYDDGSEEDRYANSILPRIPLREI